MYIYYAYILTVVTRREGSLSEKQVRTKTVKRRMRRNCLGLLLDFFIWRELGKKVVGNSGSHDLKGRMCLISAEMWPTWASSWKLGCTSSGRVQGRIDPVHVGGYQNYCPLLGPLNIRCRIILRTQKGTIILTTAHVLGGHGKGLGHLLAARPEVQRDGYDLRRWRPDRAGDERHRAVQGQVLAAGPRLWLVAECPAPEVRIYITGCQRSQSYRLHRRRRVDSFLDPLAPINRGMEADDFILGQSLHCDYCLGMTANYT